MLKLVRNARKRRRRRPALARGEPPPKLTASPLPLPPPPPSYTPTPTPTSTPRPPSPTSQPTKLPPLLFKSQPTPKQAKSACKPISSSNVKRKKIKNKTKNCKTQASSSSSSKSNLNPFQVQPLSASLATLKHQTSNAGLALDAALIAAPLAADVQCQYKRQYQRQCQFRCEAKRQPHSQAKNKAKSQPQPRSKAQAQTKRRRRKSSKEEALLLTSPNLLFMRNASKLAVHSYDSAGCLLRGCCSRKGLSSSLKIKSSHSVADIRDHCQANLSKVRALIDGSLCRKLSAARCALTWPPAPKIRLRTAPTAAPAVAICRLLLLVCCALLAVSSNAVQAHLAAAEHQVDGAKQLQLIFTDRPIASPPVAQSEAAAFTATADEGNESQQTAPRLNTIKLAATNFIEAPNQNQATTTTTTTTQQPERKWPILALGSLIVIGATGNVFVCLAIWFERRLQTATNYFLMSLAVADLLVCTLVMPFGIIYEFYGFWPFDWQVCNLWVTSDVLTCSSSILHMCFISVGRYIGIRNPLHARQAKLFVSRRAVLWRIAVAWLLSTLIASPITLMSLRDLRNIVPREFECAIANKWFRLIGSSVAFFVPMIVMVNSYIMTVRLLSKRAKFVTRSSLTAADGVQGAAATTSHGGSSGRVGCSVRRSSGSGDSKGSKASKASKASKQARNSLGSSAPQVPLKQQLAPALQNGTHHHQTQLLNQSGASPNLAAPQNANVIARAEPKPIDDVTQLDPPTGTVANRAAYSEKKHRQHHRQHHHHRTVTPAAVANESPQSPPSPDDRSKPEVGNTCNAKLNYRRRRPDELISLASLAEGGAQAASLVSNATKTAACDSNSAGDSLAAAGATRSTGAKSLSSLAHSRRDGGAKISGADKSVSGRKCAKCAAAIDAAAARRASSADNCNAQSHSSCDRLLHRRPNCRCRSTTTATTTAATTVSANGHAHCDENNQNHSHRHCERRRNSSIVNDCAKRRRRCTRCQKQKSRSESRSRGGSKCSRSQRIKNKEQTADACTGASANASPPTASKSPVADRVSLAVEARGSETGGFSNAACVRAAAALCGAGTKSANENADQQPQQQQQRVQLISRKPTLPEAATTSCMPPSPQQNQKQEQQETTSMLAAAIAAAAVAAKDEADDQQLIRYLGSSNQLRNEQKATKVLGVVFFTFVVLWTPFFVINFTSGLVDLQGDDVGKWVSVSQWLGYLSSVINPVIYTVFNRNFRRAFRNILLCKRRRFNRSRLAGHGGSTRADTGHFRFGTTTGLNMSSNRHYNITLPANTHHSHPQLQADGFNCYGPTAAHTSLKSYSKITKTITTTRTPFSSNHLSNA